MTHSLVGVVLALGLVGCPKPTPAPPPSPMDDQRADGDLSPTPVVPGVITALSAAQGANPLACSTDADCAISSVRDGDCCNQLCQATNVYATDFLATLQAQHSRLCADVVCPVASCMPPTERWVATCEAGTCVATSLPIGRREPPARPTDTATH